MTIEELVKRLSLLVDKERRMRRLVVALLSSYGPEVRLVDDIFHDGVDVEIKCVHHGTELTIDLIKPEGKAVTFSVQEERQSSDVTMTLEKL